MALQASAQCLKASAHRLQWSIVCFGHAARQDLHALAHSAHIAFVCSPPRAMDPAPSCWKRMYTWLESTVKALAIFLMSPF